MLWVLMAWLQGALVLLFVLHQTGVIRAAAVPVDLQRLVMMVAILAGHRLFVWLLTGDLHHPGQLSEKGSAGQIARAHRPAGAPRHADPAPQPHRWPKPPGAVAAAQASATSAWWAALYREPGQLQDRERLLGYAVGDELLCLVAERLGSGLRECDTVARLSGDEFLILLGDIQSEEAVTWQRHACNCWPALCAAGAGRGGDHLAGHCRIAARRIGRGRTAQERRPGRMYRPPGLGAQRVPLL